MSIITTFLTYVLLRQTKSKTVFYNAEISRNIRYWSTIFDNNDSKRSYSMLTGYMRITLVSYYTNLLWE